MAQEFEDYKGEQDTPMTYSRLNRHKKKAVRSSRKQDIPKEELFKDLAPLSETISTEVGETNQPEESLEETVTFAETKVRWSHRFLILFFSLLLSGLSVAVPYFTEFANSTQLQSLYTGMMFSKGQLPYTDIFATAGFLYYGVIALAYHLGTSFWLVGVQFLAYCISGIYLNKLTAHLTGYREAGGAITIIFYLLNLTFGFGGMYPIQFAMPFVLIGLWILARYVAGLVRDEFFIIYGLTGAMSILFDPYTLVFWVMSALFLVVYNTVQGHFAKGFYQSLCVLIGASGVLYGFGYFVINLGIMLPYLKQAIFYNFTAFARGSEPLAMSAGAQVGLSLVTGLLLGFILYLPHILSTRRDRLIKWLMFLVFVFHLAVLMMSQTYELFAVLGLLPYGLLLTALHLKPRTEQKLTHRKAPLYRTSQFFKQFMGKHLYLPYLAMLFAVAMPILAYLNDSTLTQERLGVGAYLTEKVSAKEAIYVWDTNALIYLSSGKKTASQFSTPTLYTAQKTNAQMLEDELLQNKATYIVVNVNQLLPTAVQKNIKSKYKQLDLTNLKHFAVYKLK